MSYCRFQNTASDLDDCFEALENREKLSKDEHRAMTRLVSLCRDIVKVAEEQGDDLGMGENPSDEEFDDREI
jgi:hypothetical protein